MRTRSWYGGSVAAFVALIFVFASSAGARTFEAPAAGAPEAGVMGVTPTNAVVGQLVTISGTSLQGTRAVTFGTVGASSVAVDPNGMWVRAVVPAGVTPGQIYITLDVQGSSNKVGPITIGSGSMSPQANPQPKVSAAKTGTSVKVVVAPRIASLSPAAGKAGSKVRIHGANLTGTKWVKFGNLRAKFTVASANAVDVVVPKNARSAKVWVHTSGGTSSSAQRFRVVRAAI